MWSSKNVFLGNDMQIFPEPLHVHGISAEDCMGLLTDFKKKMQQTEHLVSRLIQVEVPDHSLLLNIRNTINMATEIH